MNAVQRPTLEYASTPKLADHLRLVLILRHIAMIFALTFFGGCVIGLVAAGETSQGGALPTPILVLPNLLLGSIGFSSADGLRQREIGGHTLRGSPWVSG